MMKKLQILGTGCAKCQKLAAVTEDAAKAICLSYAIEKVTEIDRIVAFGVMSTPARVVDGQIKVAGKVPSFEDMKQLLA